MLCGTYKQVILHNYETVLDSTNVEKKSSDQTRPTHINMHLSTVTKWINDDFSLQPNAVVKLLLAVYNYGKTTRRVHRRISFKRTLSVYRGSRKVSVTVLLGQLEGSYPSKQIDDN